jgi:PelA/Pel-15E family pectate lyase
MWFALRAVVSRRRRDGNTSLRLRARPAPPAGGSGAGIFRPTPLQPHLAVRRRVLFLLIVRSQKLPCAGIRLACRLAAAGLLLATTAARAAEAWFEPVTLERVIALLTDQQRPWLEYLALSRKHFAEEKAFRAAEAAAARIPDLKLAPYATVFGVNLDQPVAWFATPEGRRITVNILSYQTPTGGWSKRLDLSKEPRAPGTDFVSEHNAHYEGTFDNDSVTTQMRALARAVKATGSDPARAAFLRGLNYIFIAQYPNGGWPQIYPIEGGYHDAIPYNDDAVTNNLALLREIATGRPDFDFVPVEQRREAGTRADRGIACVLASQIRVEGKLTGWCQQHDALTLKPCAARAFEPAGMSSSESADVMHFLISLPAPSLAVVASIKGVAEWLKKNAIMGFAWRNTPDNGRLLIPEPGAGPLWSRLYEIGTDRPIFGGANYKVLYDVNQVSRERRGGYNWYPNSPARQLEGYPAWLAKYGR